MGKLTNSSALGALLSVIMITAITIYGELNPVFKDFLKSFTGHHWITKSYLAVMIYVLGLALAQISTPGEISDGFVRKSIWLLIVISFTASIALIAFFIWHS